MWGKLPRTGDDNDLFGGGSSSGGQSCQCADPDGRTARSTGRAAVQGSIADSGNVVNGGSLFKCGTLEWRLFINCQAN
jgi:hypothetical protein